MTFPTMGNMPTRCSYGSAAVNSLSYLQGTKVHWDNEGVRVLVTRVAHKLSSDHDFLVLVKLIEFLNRLQQETSIFGGGVGMNEVSSRRICPNQYCYGVALVSCNFMFMFMSCRAMWCHCVMSCRVVSCRVVSCRVVVS